MGKPEMRAPAVAGQFYAGTAGELSREVDRCLDTAVSRVAAVGCVAPHAGYMYSGRVAGAVFSRVEMREKVFLIGPNHTGLGTPFSVMASGEWKTPLGNVPVDSRLAAEAIACSDGLFADDSLAHLREHSLEVELPFLQKLSNNFSIVPLTVASDDGRALAAAGGAIAAAISRLGLGPRTLMVASSDMSHYEPRESAERKDRLAIEAILALDPERLLRVVRQKDISMCGYAPTAIMLWAAKALGASGAELVKYQTSGDVTGDMSSVVGYAGIIIS